MDRIKPEFMKKLTKFIVISIWVSSLLVTHNFYLCKLTIQLVTHAVDKMYMFLVCNGLLVFVAKYSGLISSSNSVEESTTDQTFDDHRDFDGYDEMMKLEYYSVHERRTKTFLTEEVSTQDQETEEEKEGHEDEEEEEEEEESDEPLANNGDLEEECDINGETREEEDDVGMVTEEDMNKKFDEFIRKMKEELRIEARRQLILV
ncbi:unnamed protein product [Eruca vesicaria subsp. sativa]|uniref:Uncharacterized protein n=1 Tax=Eruca vesicaria subsp. sativa TaxID=29727 RepID=A0ABC8LMR1_ERUVS|nr:unnamed protein product [Eruca vesicaria subsp. sativa]